MQMSPTSGGFGSSSSSNNHNDENQHYHAHHPLAIPPPAAAWMAQVLALGWKRRGEFNRLLYPRGELTQLIVDLQSVDGMSMTLYKRDLCHISYELDKLPFFHFKMKRLGFKTRTARYHSKKVLIVEVRRCFFQQQQQHHKQQNATTTTTTTTEVVDVQAMQLLATETPKLQQQYKECPGPPPSHPAHDNIPRSPAPGFPASMSSVSNIIPPHHSAATTTTTLKTTAAAPLPQPTTNGLHPDMEAAMVPHFLHPHNMPFPPGYHHHPPHPTSFCPYPPPPPFSPMAIGFPPPFLAHPPPQPPRPPQNHNNNNNNNNNKPTSNPDPPIIHSQTQPIQQYGSRERPAPTATTTTTTTTTTTAVTTIGRPTKKVKQEEEVDDDLVPQNDQETKLLQELKQMGFEDDKEILDAIRRIKFRNICESNNRNNSSGGGGGGRSIQALLQHQQQRQQQSYLSADTVMLNIISQREEMDHVQKEDQARVESERIRKAEASRLRLLAAQEKERVLQAATLAEWRESFFPKSWILHTVDAYDTLQAFLNDHVEEEEDVVDYDDEFDEKRKNNKKRMQTEAKKNRNNCTSTTVKNALLRLLKLERDSQKWYKNNLPRVYYLTVVNPNIQNFSVGNNTPACDLVAYLVEEADRIQHALCSLHGKMVFFCLFVCFFKKKKRAK